MKKLIFSRKGFDSSYGGMASPIFENGQMVSLPIPDHDQEACLTYQDLTMDIAGESFSYGSLIEQLQSRKTEKLSSSLKAHVDPDIYRNRPLHPQWRGLFGQDNHAQSHLANRHVDRDDLFLFFGWFKQVEKKADGTYGYQVGAPDLHVLFGYLQIGARISVAHREDCAEVLPWAENHPHVFYPQRPNNTLYVARETLTFAPDLPGYGTFDFSEDLVRTTQGKSMSHWWLPACFHPDSGVTVSRNENKDNWEPVVDGRCGLKTVSIGQDFVVSENDAVTDWVQTLIRTHAKRDTLSLALG